MTYDDVKDLLKNIQRKKSIIKSLKSYIAEEKSLLSDITGITYDVIVVSSSFVNKTEDRYINILDCLQGLEDRFNKLFNEMCMEENLILEMMGNLSPVEYETITNRYFRGISIKETADMMHYSTDGIKSIQKRAIKKMSKP